MFSRTHFKTPFAAMTAAVLAVSCARENEPATLPIAVNLKGNSDCLSSFSDRLGDFTRARMSASATAEFWDCTARAVRDYQRITHGDAPGGKYTPQAVRHFLQRYFLKASAISDSLLTGIMRIKRVLVAGGSEHISPEELSRLQALIGEIKAASLRVQPHAAVVFLRQAEATELEVQAAVDSLMQAASMLGRWLAAQGQPYAFSDMSQLVREVFKISGLRASEAEVAKSVAAVASLKRLLVAGGEDGIAGKEWARVVDQLARGYAMYLHVNYSFGGDLNTGLAGEGLPRGLELLADVLQQAVSAREDRRLPSGEWRELTRRFAAAGWLPAGRQDAVYNAWTWLMRRPMGRGDADLGPSEVGRLRALARRWIGLLAGQTAPRLDQVLAASPPMSWDDQGRMIFAPAMDANWAPKHRRRMIWPYVLIDLLRASYVGEAEFLTEEQMLEVTAEVVPLLQDFGWLRSVQPSVGKRLLREADLFTHSGNGDGRLDTGEAVRELAMVASALRTAELWLAAAETECQGRAAECVRRVGFHDPDVFSAMPGLQLQFRREGLEAFRRYLRQAEQTVLDQPVEQAFSTSDLVVTLILLEYVETFLLRFDTDRSGTIELPEAMEAFKVYGPTLARMLSNVGLPEDEVLAFFTFMMKYGDTPFTMLGGQVRYNHWKWHRKDWAFKADRTILVSILNQLSKL